MIDAHWNSQKDSLETFARCLKVVDEDRLVKAQANVQYKLHWAYWAAGTVSVDVLAKVNKGALLFSDVEIDHKPITKLSIVSVCGVVNNSYPAHTDWLVSWFMLVQRLALQPHIVCKSYDSYINYMYSGSPPQYIHWFGYYVNFYVHTHVGQKAWHLLAHEPKTDDRNSMITVSTFWLS